MNVVIACGAMKLATPAEAHRLYVGSYFLATRAWALSVTDLNHLFILSAKYGLVPARTVLHPYDVTLKTPGCITAQAVRDQLRQNGIGDVVFVGGRPYADLLRRAGATTMTPFAGYGGMGYQMHALKVHRGRVPDGVAAWATESTAATMPS